MTDTREMKELVASNMGGAAKPLNPVMSINLQPAQMQTGCTLWMGELLEKLRITDGKEQGNIAGSKLQPLE